MAYIVPEIVIGSDESGHPPTGFLLIDYKKVPLPEFSPPDYITGFRFIHIR
jgi:hypothetical protein